MLFRSPNPCPAQMNNVRSGRVVDNATLSAPRAQGVDRFISSFRDARQAVDLNMAAILSGTENGMHPPQTGGRSLVLFVISLALVRTSISPREIVLRL